MRLAIRVAAALVLLVLTAGCAQGAFRSQPPDRTPDLRGVVTSIGWSGDTQQSALIVWTEDPVVGAKAAYDAASVTFTNDTGYYRMVDGALESGSPASIVVGSVVEVWFTGAVAESYPVQATADAIVAVGTYSKELPEPPGLQP